MYPEVTWERVRQMIPMGAPREYSYFTRDILIELVERLYRVTMMPGYTVQYGFRVAELREKQRELLRIFSSIDSAESDLIAHDLLLTDIVRRLRRLPAA